MKKLLIAALMLILGVSIANATITIDSAYTAKVGYSGAWFVISYDTTSVDSSVSKIYLYTGTTHNNIAKTDSISASFTIPDTVKEAVGKFVNGTTYYWYMVIQDSAGSARWPANYREYRTFTTTNFTQHLTITTGYSTARVIHDSVGYYVTPSESLYFKYGTVLGTYGTTSKITTVTYPDTFAITGLMEGGTYYGICIEFEKDSLGTNKCDTSAVYTFSTTDLTVGITAMTQAGDSIGIICDTNTIIVDSLIFQYGAGLVTANPETLTTVTGVDTFYVKNMIAGGVYSYRILAFLPDSSAIETTSTYTYTTADPTPYTTLNTTEFGGIVKRYKFDLTTADETLSTGPIDVTPYKSMKLSGMLLGEDNAAAYDSAVLLIRTLNNLGNYVSVITVVNKDPDTVTIGVQPVIFDPIVGADSTVVKAQDFYQYIDVAGFLTCFADSVAKAGNVIGHRPFYVTLEFQKE